MSAEAYACTDQNQQHDGSWLRHCGPQRLGGGERRTAAGTERGSEVGAPCVVLCLIAAEILTPIDVIGGVDGAVIIEISRQRERQARQVATGHYAIGGQ